MRAQRAGTGTGTVTGTTGGLTPLYKADAEWCDHVKKIRARMAHVCGQCMNRPVRVQTIDCRTYEGVVVGHDANYLHLMTGPAGDSRFWGPASAAAITTLVLFELLVITLLI
jgi:hypothetical protein